MLSGGSHNWHSLALLYVDVLGNVQYEEVDSSCYADGDEASWENPNDEAGYLATYILSTGSYIYVITIMWPDVVYVLIVFRQYSLEMSNEHIVAVMNIFDTSMVWRTGDCNWEAH